MVIEKVFIVFFFLASEQSGQRVLAFWLCPRTNSSKFMLLTTSFLYAIGSPSTVLGLEHSYLNIGMVLGQKGTKTLTPFV